MSKLILRIFLLLASVFILQSSAKLIFSSQEYSSSESKRYAEIVIIRSEDLDTREVGYFQAASNTAVDGFDFQGISSKEIVLEPGTNYVTVPIELYDNYWLDGSRVVDLKIFSDGVPTQSATLTILDDEETQSSFNMLDRFRKAIEGNFTTTIETISTTTTTSETSTTTTTTSTTTSIPTSTATTPTTTTIPTNTTSGCLLGCDGICNSGKTYDACNVCGNPQPQGYSPYQDCRGFCFGPNKISECGVCYNPNVQPPENDGKNECGKCGNDLSCIGCDGVINSTLHYDACGVCGGDNSTCTAFLNIIPVAERNINGVVVTLYGAGFQDPTTHQNRALVANFGAQTGLTVNVINMYSGTVTLSTFASLGTFPVTLTINSQPPQFVNPVTYTVLPPGMAANGQIFKKYVNDPATNFTVSGTDFTSVPNADLLCILTYSDGQVVQEVGYLVDSQTINCLAPLSTVSQKVGVQISVNDGQTMVPITSPGTLEIHYYERAPNVTVAYFTPSGAFIQVLFDADIKFRGNEIVPGDLISCDTIFVPDSITLISSQSTCTFLSLREIQISLSPNAIIVPYDTIQILPDTPTTIISLEGDPLYQDPYNNTLIVVLPPDPLPIPVAVITSPTSVGLCNPFTVSAELSTGNGGRAFVKYTWTMTPSNSVVDALLNSLTPTTSSFVVPENLPPGTYEISLVVESIFATSPKTTITVVKQNFNAPDVTIPGPNPLYVRLQDETTLQTLINGIACQPAQIVLFTWSMSQGGQSVTFPFLTQQQSASSLTIPSYTLTYLATYEVTVSVKTATSQSQSFTLTVIVLPSNLDLIFVGGPQRPVAPYAAVTLKENVINYSRTVRPFSYALTCYNPTLDQTCLVQRGTGTGFLLFAPGQANTLADTTPSQLTQAISAGSLIDSVNLRYVFTMKVTPFDGADSTSATQELVFSDSQLVVFVFALNYDGQSFSNDKELSLVATVTGGDDPYTYQWSTVSTTVTRGNQDVGTATVDLEDPNNLNSPNGLNSLTLKSDVLLSGGTYLFRCDVTDSQNRTGWGTLQVNVGQNPSSGTITISPEAGQAAITVFTISMVGWTDDPEDFPLQYSFRVSYSRTGRIEFPQQSSNSIVTTLPQQVDQASVTITGFVYGARGGISQASLEITLDSCIPTTGADVDDLQQKFQAASNSLAQIGDWRGARSMTLAYASCLIAGGQATKKRSYDASTQAKVLTFMNDLVEYLIDQVFPGIPPSNADSLINVCAVDAITPLPNYLLQSAAFQLSSVINQQIETLQGNLYNELSDSFMDCLARSLGNTLAAGSYLSLTPNSTLSSPIYNNATASVLSAGSLYLSQYSCGRNPSNFPLVLTSTLSMQWTLSRNSLSGATVIVDDGAQTINQTSFSFAQGFTLNNINCFCTSAVQLDRGLLSFIPLPKGATVLSDNAADALSQTGQAVNQMTSGQPISAFSNVNNPRNGGFRVLANGAAIELRDCSYVMGGTAPTQTNSYTTLSVSTPGQTVTQMTLVWPNATEYDTSLVYVCVFYNVATSSWDSTGVTLTSISSTFATCSSTHLTGFSLLQQVPAAPVSPIITPPAGLPAGIIALIAVLAALAALALLAVLFAYARRKKSDEERLKIQTLDNRILDFNTLNEEDHGLTGILPPAFIPIKEDVKEEKEILPIDQMKNPFVRPPPYVMPPSYAQFLYLKNGETDETESEGESEEEEETESEETGSGSESESGSTESESESETGSGSEESETQSETESEEETEVSEEGEISGESDSETEETEETEESESEEGSKSEEEESESEEEEEEEESEEEKSASESGSEERKGGDSEEDESGSGSEESAEETEESEERSESEKSEGSEEESEEEEEEEEEESEEESDEEESSAKSSEEEGSQASSKKSS